MDSQLLIACESNDLTLISKLLKDGANPNFTIDEGYTPLMICAGSESLEATKLLLDAGAKPDLKNSSGSSALKIACLKNHSGLIKMLLEQKANPDLLDRQGFTPLMYCAMNGYVDAARLLLDWGADPKMKSLRGGCSAIDFAKKVNNSEMITLLEKVSGEKITPPAVEEINPEKLVGQNEAKISLEQIISLTKVNQERIKRNIPASKITLHAIFSGSPGTGKTTFARYYAQEIKKLGILKKGHLIEVSRSDLVAEYAGQTAIKTKKVIESALGGILFIDEAYSLKTGKDDNFGQEAIDTIIKLIEDHRGELIVILAGYTNEMREFAHTNPGLKSRIPNYVEFKDYTDEELSAIFDIMLKSNNLSIDPKDKSHAIAEIVKERKSRSFGNGRSVRNFIDRSIAQQSIRLGRKDLSKLSMDELCKLTFSDLTLDPNDEGSSQELEEKRRQDKPKTAFEEFEALVGFHNVKAEIKGLADFIRVSKIRNNGKIPNLGLHMIFEGNPGTGKSTVARLLGRIFKELGFLSEGHLVEADRSKLVAPYVGQTAIKTLDLIEEALGGVLFIDEAYTLHRGSHSEDTFGQEAIDTLMKYMEDYRSRFIVVLAGYQGQMDIFLASNPGLASRFSRKLSFGDFTDEELIQISKGMATEAGFVLSEKALTKLMQEISHNRKSQEYFANARVVRNILESAFKRQASRLVKQGTPESMKLEELNLITEEDF